MGMIEISKKAAVDVINSLRLADVRHGTVINASPLRVQINQKLILEKQMLTLTKNVVDYQTEIKINDGTKQECTIYNALKSGDKVTLIRYTGEQQFIVLDKVY